MHISTHEDKIFYDGCWQREWMLTPLLEQKFPNDLVELVDAVWPHDAANYKRIISDTIFLYDVDAELLPLHPEVWGYFFRTKQVAKNKTPTKRLCCLMNRLSGERLQLFYKLDQRGLIENNEISFNCLNATRDPGPEARQQAFADMHAQCDWPEFNEQFEKWKDRVPVLLGVNNPDSATLNAEVSIVSETYTSDSTIAFSEKIFRALQMPRPWLLNCSPGSVSVLREHGFDVLDDVVNHNSYDHLYDGRIDAILDELDNVVYNQERCEQAALHNHKRLNELNQLWPEKLKWLLTAHAG